jgi:hypothetical protein
MAASVLTIWITLLAGAVLLCGLLTRARAARVDPQGAMLAGGLASLACLTAASLYIPPQL